MERTDVWFGSMTHGNFSVGRDDEERMVVIHSIDERSFMLAPYPPVGKGYESYVVLSEFTGTIVFSKEYVRLLRTERIEK